MRTSKNLIIAVVLGVGMLGALSAHAHCQIPCGIYGDETRFTLLGEHITTIEKSMNTIVELSAKPGENANQLVRWVMNKEDHVGQFVEIITAYFLQQRITPAAEGSDGWNTYVQRVTLCHQMLVSAMKAKQTTDLEVIKSLRENLEAFHHSYAAK